MYGVCMFADPWREPDALTRAPHRYDSVQLARELVGCRQHLAARPLRYAGTLYLHETLSYPYSQMFFQVPRGSVFPNIIMLSVFVVS